MSENAPETPDELIPVSLLTGFLGSGKTTVLNHVLHDPRMDKAAVIVNEFGDVGIDGAILEGHDLDMIELTSGCLCCTLKGSLLNAVEELNAKADIDSPGELIRDALRTDVDRTSAKRGRHVGRVGFLDRKRFNDRRWKQIKRYDIAGQVG